MLVNDHVAYGKRNGKLIFIEDVPSGQACGCVCASCDQPLIAKKGAIRLHHFAHTKFTKCQGAAESVLHLLSKELLAELDAVVIPPYDFSRQRKTKAGTLVQHQARVAKGGPVPVHGVKVEIQEEGFIPDIIIESGSKSLIVEVAVTHKVDRAKLRRIRKRDLPAIEIKLAPRDALLPRQLLREKLQSDLSSKAWLFHPAQREAEREFLTMWRDANAQDRLNKAMLRQRKPTQGAASPRSGYRATLLPPVSEYDRTANEFRSAHGRYPTTEECLKLWPNLWKP